MEASRRHAFMNRGTFVGLILCLSVLSMNAWAVPTSPAKQYEKVRGTYFSFKADPKKKKFRHDWIQVIARFQSFLKLNRDSKEACRASYTEAELWRGLYDVSRVNADVRHALGAYEAAEELCRGTTLADDALWQQVVITAKRKSRYPEATELAERLVLQFPVSDMAPRARDWLRKHGVAQRPGVVKKVAVSPSVKGRLLGRGDSDDNVETKIDSVKSWSNEDYVRVAIYLNKPTEFRVGAIAGDKSGKAGGRIFVDIPKSKTNVKSIRLETPVVTGVRMASRQGGSTRVVLDLGQASTDYSTLILENPFRIVVDVVADKVANTVVKPAYTPKLHKTLVVIDPGHGGKDTGATGQKGLKEKDVALRISLELKRVLEAAGLAARLTRTKDEFVALEERTAFANRLNADVFLSIHANAHDDSRVHGVESYYLDSTNDKYALRLAAVENKVREERVSEIQIALAQVSSKLYTSDSKRIATNVTDALSDVAKRKTGRTRNLGVKPSLFYVLLGARMPAVLVEASFVTNAKDAKMLGSKNGTKAIGKAIGEAVLDYLKDSKAMGRR